MNKVSFNNLIKNKKMNKIIKMIKKMMKFKFNKKTKQLIKFNYMLFKIL